MACPPPSGQRTQCEEGNGKRGTGGRQGGMLAAGRKLPPPFLRLPTVPHTLLVGKGGVHKQNHLSQPLFSECTQRTCCLNLTSMRHLRHQWYPATGSTARYTYIMQAYGEVASKPRLWVSDPGHVGWDGNGMLEPSSGQLPVLAVSGGSLTLSSRAGGRRSGASAASPCLQNSSIRRSRGVPVCWERRTQVGTDEENGGWGEGGPGGGPGGCWAIDDAKHSRTIRLSLLVQCKRHYRPSVHQVHQARRTGVNR